MKPSSATRRHLRWLAVLAVPPVALGAAACAPSAPPSESVTTITTVDYFTDDPTRSIVGDQLDACAEEAGVTLERESVPASSYVARVLQLASAQNLPDLLMLDNPDVKQFATTGALTPLSAFDFDLEGIPEGVLGAAEHDGEVYAVGPIVNLTVLYYNADVLAQLGLEPPTTWDELAEVAAAATDTSAGRYGLAFAAPADPTSTWTFLPFLWSNGGSEDDLASPEAEEALQYWVDLVGSGSASSSVLNWGQSDVGDQFLAGNAAMMINTPARIPTLEEQAAFEWSVVAIPAPTAGADTVVPFGGEMWTIPVSDSPARQAKAAEVLECFTAPENQLAHAIERGQLPVSDTVTDEFIAERPIMEAFVGQVPTARARTAVLGDKWPIAADAIYGAIQAGITGQSTPADALQRAADQVAAAQ